MNNILEPSIVLPLNIRKLIDWEKQQEVKQYIYIETNDKLKLHLDVLERGLNLLWVVLEKTTPLSEQESVIYKLGAKLFNDIGASLSLILKGYYSNSIAIQRNIIELSFLFEFFYLRPQHILKWRKNSKSYSAKWLYTKIDNIKSNPFKGAKDKMYSYFCTYGSHISHEGLDLIMKDEALCIGPMEDYRKLERTISDLTTQSTFSIFFFCKLINTKYVTKLMKLKLLFLKASNDWWTNSVGILLLTKEDINLLDSLLTKYNIN